MKSSIVFALVLLVATPALAQEVDIKKPAPTRRERLREPGVIEPGLSREERPIEADNYPPGGGRVPLEPAFFRGVSTKTSTGRVGLAGWTAPNVPLGGQVAGWHEINGWFVIGFTATWGAPPEAPGRSTP